MVPSAQAAKERVEQEGSSCWTWVHCDDKNLATVRDVFVGQGATGHGAGANGGGKKRKRVENSGPAVNDQAKDGEFGLSVQLGTCRIVADEFVMQSLILGTLIET